MSRYLNETAARGLCKVGDILIPGGEGFPSFTESGVVGDADRALEYLPKGDREGLVTLLKVIAFMPRFKIRWLITLLDEDMFFPFIGGLLRLLRLGIKWIVYTVYYSHPKIHPLVHWDATVNPGGAGGDK